MSFAEWTATSILPASSASSISLTKTPREPISPKGFVRSLSPAVVIGTSANSTPSPRSRSAASSACVSASRLPRLPMRIRVERFTRPFQPEEVADGVGVRRAVGAGGRLLQPHRRVVPQLVDDLYRERLGTRGGAFDTAGANGLVKVVHVVEKRVGQRSDLRVEVARDGEVD